MKTIDNIMALKLADELERCWADPGLQLRSAAELRRQHAELYQWESVFRHLGTADECGNEWIGLQAEVEALREALKEERRVRLLGQEPDVHWETLRDIRRACYAKTDAASHKEKRMTDRELLELAAKAAGMQTFGQDNSGALCIDPVDYVPWNPLTDDGDALRLAVRLNILNTRSTGYEWPELELFERDKDDAQAATRRAIVEAAAEIGRAVK